MAEKMQFHARIRNGTGKPLLLSGKSLSDGKWMTSPPSQIANGTDSYFAAQGKANSAVGTEGNVVYQGFDGTKFTIKWNVPWSGANSGGLTCYDKDSGACSTTYRLCQTDSGYSKPQRTPTKGNKVRTYFVIEKS